MSMSDRDGKIWFDGQLIDWRDAKIHVLSHSLHYGLSVFEGVRAYETELGTAIFRLPEHTRRLLNSAKIFQMKVPFDAATLEEAQKAKKDEAEYRRWVNAHRALWMGYWWNAYHYYTYWQAGYWYYY